MNYLAEIIKFANVLKPVEAPSERDWRRVEKELGLEFPEDFKGLLSAIGGGDFGTGLCFQNPVSSWLSTRFSRDALLEYREPIEGLIAKLDLILFPDKGGLVMIGTIDRQDFLLRPDRDGRLVDLLWFNIDTEDLRDLACSVTQFLYDLYLRRRSEPWALELSDYVWRRGTAPFFVPRKGRSG
jgi:hypothetical protein